MVYLPQVKNNVWHDVWANTTVSRSDTYILKKIFLDGLNYSYIVTICNILCYCYGQTQWKSLESDWANPKLSVRNCLQWRMQNFMKGGGLILLFVRSTCKNFVVGLKILNMD